jgi:hypothetical protein
LGTPTREPRVRGLKTTSSRSSPESPVQGSRVLQYFREPPEESMGAWGSRSS